MAFINAYRDNLKYEFRVAHHISTSWTMKNYHFHDAFEILFSLSNTTKLFIEDTMYDVEKNDLFIMNNSELHRIIAPSNVVYDRYIIMFNPKFIEDYSSKTTDLLKCFIDRKNNSSNRIHLSEEQVYTLLPLFKKIEHYSKQSSYGSDIYMKINFIELLLLINSYYENFSNLIPAPKTGDFKKVELLLTYINENLDSDLSLDRLADKFFLSKYYISHLFKDNTGFSVSEYIINRRILKAKELLRQNLSLSEICEMVGFNNESHFIRTFKKLVGAPPKQYSKKYYSSFTTK